MYEAANEFMKKSHSLKLNSREKWCWQILFFFCASSQSDKMVLFFVQLFGLSGCLLSFLRSHWIDCYCRCCFFFLLPSGAICAVVDVVSSVNMIYIKSQLIYEKDEEKHLPSCQPATIWKQRTHTRSGTHTQTLNIDGNGVEAVCNTFNRPQD